MYIWNATWRLCIYSHLHQNYVLSLRGFYLGWKDPFLFVYLRTDNYFLLPDVCWLLQSIGRVFSFFIFVANLKLGCLGGAVLPSTLRFLPPLRSIESQNTRNFSRPLAEPSPSLLCSPPHRSDFNPTLRSTSNKTGTQPQAVGHLVLLGSMFKRDYLHLHTIWIANREQPQ